MWPREFSCEMLVYENKMDQMENAKDFPPLAVVEE